MKIGKSIKTYPRFPVAHKTAIWNRSHVSIARYMAEIFPIRRETLYNKSISVIYAYRLNRILYKCLDNKFTCRNRDFHIMFK